ncbi:capsule biosynthesis protein CapA [Listeria grandensis]|uniref:Capsule biosynthesis protein CapA n=1 Tax=Listeria grandensis TaxID=1494963 RepID=A0A7X1CQK7_9LIST|nr:Wzz/FepE/Etk N-terminal domain-containing protein [Listeria grandensis]MBC1475130.1 capsule biosynthesis protein CapA [Listeria grandensis]MBC1937136.1 capsule biosynthesis protein CapA [Listeria grandensis]
MRQVITINSFLRGLKKMWSLLIIIPVVLILVTAVSTLWAKPIYTSSTQVLVTTTTQKDEMQSFEGVRTSIQLSNTFSTTLASARTMQGVIDKYKLDITPSELAKKVTVASGENSLVYTITVTDRDPSKIKQLTNGIAEVSQKDFTKLFSSTKMVVLEKASTPVEASNLIKYILAGMFGIVLAFVLIILQASYDNTIRQKVAIDELGITFLGDMPFIKGGKE